MSTGAPRLNLALAAMLAALAGWFVYDRSARPDFSAPAPVGETAPIQR